MKLKLGKLRADLRSWMRLRKASRWRAKAKARFIGITGSSGKSTTASMLGHILSLHASVLVQVEINTISALTRTLYKRMRKAGKLDYVVVEAGAWDAGSIRAQAELMRPDVAVVTMVQLEHFTSFRTLEAVAKEKRALVEVLPSGGLAVLNADDPNVLGMASAAKCRVVTFGQKNDADYRVADIHAAYPDLLRFSVHWRGGKLDIRTAFPGEHFWLPVAAAIATALELGVSPQNVATSIASFKPLSNRCTLHTVEGGPQFLVDTTKSPWHSLYIAYDMMAKATASHKRIVLGQISDYAGSSRKYGSAYAVARDIADEVIYTGDNSHRSRASQADRESGRFLEIRSPKEVSDHIRATAVAGELILLKSASNLHLERIALAWTHDVKCWVPVCGLGMSCQMCGLYEIPFEQHQQHLAQARKSRRRQRLLRLIGR